MRIKFRNMEELKIFEKQCSCDDRYTDIHVLTFQGTFYKAQLNLATKIYRGDISIEDKYVPPQDEIDQINTIG